MRSFKISTKEYGFTQSGWIIFFLRARRLEENVGLLLNLSSSNGGKFDDSMVRENDFFDSILWGFGAPGALWPENAVALCSISVWIRSHFSTFETLMTLFLVGQPCRLNLIITKWMRRLCYNILHFWLKGSNENVMKWHNLYVNHLTIANLSLK